jgi:hypothetical protein
MIVARPGLLRDVARRVLSRDSFRVPENARQQRYVKANGFPELSPRSKPVNNLSGFSRITWNFPSTEKSAARHLSADCQSVIRVTVGDDLEFAPESARRFMDR